MRQTQLTRNDFDFDSIEWALETHTDQPDTGEYHFALLFGNEDAPDRESAARRGAGFRLADS